MGQMHFLAPNRGRLPPDAEHRAYLAGLEGIPWRSDNQWRGDVLTMNRGADESGNLYVPWLVDEQGEVMLSTASLCERRQPYLLPVELARGTLNRLRNQLAAWHAAGLQASPRVQELLHAAQQAFARSATSQADPLAADAIAQEAIGLALAASDELVADFTHQALAQRRQSQPRLGVLLAGDVGGRKLGESEGRVFCAAFNTAVVPFTWSEIEVNAGEFDWSAYDAQIAWCRQHGLKVAAGPLLLLDRRSVPDWLFLWEDDPDELIGYMTNFVEQTASRYAGQVHLWNCGGRLNVPDVLRLEEEFKLQLAAAMIQAVRRCDPKSPVVMSFDRPWAEHLAHEDLDLSPLHFADALLRAEVGVAGFGLEINLAYTPGGTEYRDLLEISRQIDRWSLLGAPLLVQLTLPSSAAEDPRARGDARAAPLWNPSPERQASEAQRIVELLLCKQAVHGVIWSQWRDGVWHEFPHGGLVDHQGMTKPALAALTTLRRTHLV